MSRHDRAVDLVLIADLAELADLAAVARDDKGPGEKNTYGLPEGGTLRAELVKWFKKQRAEALAWAPPPTAPLPDKPPDFTDWDDPMSAAMAPILSVYWDDAGKETRASLGLDPGDWSVKNPEVKKAIEGASLDFCAATNATTSKQIGTALANVRAALAAGIVDEGESLDQLTKRVNQVFESAEKWRARRIAATEASRAAHAGQQAAAEGSGVVAGYEWLVSSDACPLCQKVAAEARRVKVGRNFAVVGGHAEYAQIRHPPLHPGCQCSITEVLTPEFGGPENPEWAETLVQPKVGPQGYTPPKGSPVPEPDPAARKPKPKLKPKPGPKAPPAVAPKAVGPSGKPVGEALEVKATRATKGAVKHAVGQIDKVHGDGALPTIPVRSDGRMAANGQYVRTRLGNRPVEIAINPKGDAPALTLVHEVGHFLEKAAIPGADARGTRDWGDGLFGPWLEAVVKTDSVKRLRELKANPTITWTANGRALSVKTPAAHLAYLTTATELWARSYAQYVAVRSGDKRLLDDLDGRRSQAGSGFHLPTQWYDDDFAPVAAAIDELFATLGWRQ